MKYRDPEKEESLKASKLAELRKLSTDYSESSKLKYNIVTNTGPRKVITNPEKIELHSRNWNFINHLPKDQQPKAPIIYDESFNKSFTRTNPPPTSLISKNHREFSILNNKFIEDHDIKESTEKDILKQRIIDKYWSTHDYDPIRGKYMDPEKEEGFIYERNFKQSVHGLDQFSKIAPRYLFLIYIV